MGFDYFFGTSQYGTPGGFHHILIRLCNRIECRRRKNGVYAP